MRFTLGAVLTVGVGAMVLGGCTPPGGNGTSTSTSSSTSGGSTSTSSSSSTGGSSSSAQCGSRQEERPCNSTAQCACGLECIASQCLKPCETAGEQSTCAATQLCVDIPDEGTYCKTTKGQDELCDLNTDDCGPGLECQVGGLDDQQQPNPEAAACHVSCAYGGTGSECTGGTSCLPSTPGYFVIQDPPNGVQCNPDAGNTCGEGFACNELSNGALCSRPVAACGTPVDIANFQPLPDGGQREVPEGPDYICNPGPQLTDDQGNVLLEGSRFCRHYDDLDRPPQVECYALFQDAPAAGICLVLCQIPLTAGGFVNYDCPAEHFCDLEQFFSLVSPQVVCTDDSGCAEGQLCRGPFQDTGNNKVCVRPFGACQPGTAPASSSSSSSSSSGGTSTSSSSSTGGTSTSSSSSSTGGTSTSTSASTSSSSASTSSSSSSSSTSSSSSSSGAASTSSSASSSTSSSASSSTSSSGG
ncbi:MAG: hypothetical protein AB2A00_14000 [Myxococcota bacterium]